MHQDERSQDTLTLLRDGDVELKGRMPWSSNATFLAQITCGPTTSLGVYKPGRGERPLWDFPPRIYRREVAAFELSELLGWHIVPATVVRPDGPLGEGSMQRFVEADFEQHYFTLYEDPVHHDALRRVCLFDLLVNNTDRKSGHCLLGGDGWIWAIDNGLCFHPDPKIRTVIWEFGGERVPDPLLDDIDAVLGRLDALSAYLDADELDALVARGKRLLKVRTFPLADPNGRSYPWPMV